MKNILNEIKFVENDENTQENQKYIMPYGVSQKNNVFAMGRVFLCENSDGDKKILLIQKRGYSFNLRYNPAISVAINREDYLMLKRHNYPLENLKYMVLPRDFATAYPFGVEDIVRIMESIKNSGYQLIEGNCKLQ